MPSLNFKKQFAEDVKSGVKKQTIRPKRKRPIKIGDTLYLFTGMQTKNCVRLKTVKCIDVEPIKIDLSGEYLSIQIHGQYLTYTKATELAQLEGFYTFEELLEFVAHTYGNKFDGDIIKWL